MLLQVLRNGNGEMKASRLQGMQEEKDHALGSQARVAAQQADSRRRRKAAFPVGAAIFDLLALKTLLARKECRCGHRKLATVQAECRNI